MISYPARAVRYFRASHEKTGESSQVEYSPVKRNPAAAVYFSLAETRTRLGCLIMTVYFDDLVIDTEKKERGDPLSDKKCQVVLLA